MDEFTDDDDSQIFDDFQDEYPFEIHVIPNDNAIENANEEQTSTIENSETTSIDLELTNALSSFNIESFSKEILSKAGTGDLVTSLNKHWSKYVPLCYRATENPTKNMIEKDAERILFKPFEVFICNNTNSDKVIEELRQLDDPPLLCGHVFKTGEPSYFCRDCGSDPTCVLCSDCFLNSKHRHHKYKMMTSAGGGGYCDCGDVEAWKSDPSCDKHTRKEKNELQSDEDVIQKLPNDFVQRARQLFDYLLEYVIEMLCVEHKEVLPVHLRPEKETDDYITVLFNDEIHSYDQVVRTLRRVLSVDEKKAFEYATVVDREGRSSIKHGKKAQCEQVKSQVEHEMGGQSSVPPLETKVMHQSLVAHQYFAERIIVWLQKFADSSKGLKHILCQIGFTNRNENYSFVERLMLSDSTLWKSARSVIHQFFIATYFMDVNWKKEFATLYTKNYQLIWRNYVKNPDDTISLTDLAVQLYTVISLNYSKIYDDFTKSDYERSNSILKLALQLFTNNSLSKYLVANFNVLQIIMDTLIEQAKPKLNSNGRLTFQRARGRINNGNEFKRAQFILFDFKYCLISVPDAWTDQLRESFLNGFRSFVQFLKTMHGMDSVKRVSDQHIEYEPEWETGFNLLIKLQKSTSSIIDWCSSDRYTLYESFKYLLQLLYEIEIHDLLFEFKYEVKKYFNKDYRILDFDITKSDVSIHAPLTRLLAALYTRLQYHSIKLDDFKLIKDETVFINSLIEPSLRALAMVAQTNVGLWRRNGYSLLSQVYFYNNVKCRAEMFDRDLQAMQMGASAMDANEFIVTILSRFRLLDFWAKDGQEGKTDDTRLEFLNLLGEEFLQLIIMIVGERYESFIGKVNTKERLKREVIHQLCISSMAHSDIIKSIYADNEVSVNELEEVLKEVATFKSSTNPSAKGSYELKPQFLTEYNPYFYHYSRIDKTKSEEHVLAQKPESKKFLPPPTPPLFNPYFLKIRFLLHSEVLLKIFNIILKRYTSKSKSCTDGQLVRVLHLIGMALNEEKQKNEYENSEPFKFFEKVSKQKHSDNLNTNLTNVIPLISTESYKILASWTLQQLESAKTSSLKASESSSDVTMKTDEDEEKEQAKEKRKNELKDEAKKRHQKLLQKISKMQTKFIEKNKELYDTTPFEAEAAGATSICSMDFSYEQKNYVCLGPNQTPTAITPKRYRCILCQEDQEISLKNPPMVLCGYIQHSKALSKDFKKNIENIDKFDPLFMPSSLFWGIHTTTCGHVMHGNCWQKYIDGVKANEHRRHGRLFNFNRKQNEFLCPLCETISNTVLPLLPNFREFTNQTNKIIDITFDDWLTGLKNTLDHSIQKELNDDKDTFIINPFPLSSITEFMTKAVARNFDLLFSYSGATDQSSTITEAKLTDDTINIIDIFARSAFVFGMIAHPNDDDQRMAITTWNNCAYTIQAIEQLLRSENKPIFGQLAARQADLLSNLVKFASLYAISKNMKNVREYCLKILAATLPYNSVFFDSINVIDCDLFHLLVYLCFSMPHLYDNTTLSSAPCGNINEAYIFKLMLQVHCVQILLNKIKLNTFNETIEKNDFLNEFIDVNSDADEETMKIYELFEYILCISKIQTENFVKPTPKTVAKALKIALLPFMRCSVLFFNYMTDITPPYSDNEINKLNYFCKYLGISKDISILLDLNNTFFKESVTKWCTINAKSQASTVLVDYPFKINELISLPNDYIDLISSFSKMSSSLTEPDSASILCLTCGETLSSKTYVVSEIGASRVGSCTAHAYKCGKTLGLFLRIAECQVLLLHLNVNAENEIYVRGSFIPAPYLDDYGETDQGLRRGNPQHLCTTRYKKLHKIWLAHSIPDEISRSHQNNQSTLINVDWILL